MQNLTIKFFPRHSETSDINEVFRLLNTVEKHTLQFVPWAAYPYKPSVIFSMAYNPSAFLLKFFVHKNQIRVLNYITNSAIWEDSCVEFSISFDDGANYYNIEFNCIGTGLIGYGKSKRHRALLDTGIVNKVKTLSNIHAEKGKKVSWELTMIIPLSVFTHTPLSNLANTKCRANFYKCGDLLPMPHFVSWSNIKSPTPDFHLPDYFGSLQFESASDNNRIFLSNFSCSKLQHGRWLI
ncbi:MAG: carbohydrate-binding family 9-like protein [Chitinophagaceae bacterium]